MNYFDDPRLNQSSLKEFDKCPYLYKAKHLDKIVPAEDSDALTFGSAVDCYLTEGKDEFDQQYEAVARRSKHREDDAPIQLTMSAYDKVMTAIERVKSQPVMVMFDWMDTQTILTTDKYKAKLDYFGVRNNIGYIADLKTTANYDRFIRTIDDWGYYTQMSFYRMMAKRAHRNIKRFKCYFIVVDKSDNNKFGVFEISQSRLDKEEVELKKLIRRFNHTVRVNSFRPTKNKDTCRACQFYSLCDHAGCTKKDIIKIGETENYYDQDKTKFVEL